MALLSPVLAPVRRTLASGLRAKVAGPDAAATADRIWRTEGERWFHDGDPVWRVHGDAAMFAGGVRALLLQSLHPLAMYGVAEFSGYRDDPWARVASTSAYIARTTYGTVEDAEAAIATVRRIHSHVRGTAPDGRAYAADDPELLLWVHAAEIGSFLATHQALARRPLTAREADTYVAQAGLPARLLGVVDPPASVAELDAVVERFRPDLAVTEPARDAIALVLHEPPLALWGRPFYDAIAHAAVATLPGWAREMIGVRARPGALFAGRAVLAGVGWVMTTP
ncbi:oxygenase MpaB family protein [Nocardioides mangrovicus]|uniref:oxygenase MpaB family protein n=1 Tax=Nocardioides mangrovicus TaxID=2478913 RepID=UPI0018E0A94C|nr:oxygenase MpaB family protein [Nocardioides mangrovicus]